MIRNVKDRRYWKTTRFISVPAKAEVTERLETFTPVSLPEDKIKEIMRIMKSYARSKGVDELPQVDGWLG
jgi:hypothetical protein